VVRDVTVRTNKHHVVIQLHGDGDMSLERYTAEARKTLLEESLGVEVVIE
jgi:hypothetical protein